MKQKKYLNYQLLRTFYVNGRQTPNHSSKKLKEHLKSKNKNKDHLGILYSNFRKPRTKRKSRQKSEDEE